MITTRQETSYQDTSYHRLRVRLGKADLDRVGLEGATERIRQFVEQGGPHQVVTVNMQFAGLALRDPAFARVIREAHLVVADGAPLVWLSRVKGQSIPGRVTGCDLVYQSAALCVEKGYSMFLLGAAPGVAQEAARNLRAQYPGLAIAGTHHGYRVNPDGTNVSQTEREEVIATIRRSGAQFLFVALGCPKQEFWIYRNLEALQVPVCVGIGGVLDLVSNRLKRAPVWLQRAGLEWFYRLQQEPGRLWKRYVLQDIPTALRLSSAAILERVVRRAPASR